MLVDRRGNDCTTIGIWEDNKWRTYKYPKYVHWSFSYNMVSDWVIEELSDEDARDIMFIGAL